MLSYKKIADLNYCNSSENVNFISWCSYLPKFGAVEQFFKFFRNMFGHLILGFHPLKLMVPKQQIMFFYMSKNNFDSLKPVADLLPNSVLITAHPKWKEGYLIPMFFAYLFSLPFLPILLCYTYKSKGYQRKSFSSFFERYWLTFGFYYFLRIYLRLTVPKAIVVANDHRPEPRTLVLVTQELKIPTFYIQHASVNETFPPLNFDYALLEGKDSLSKYSKSGEIKSKVFLIGMPKFDKYFSGINKSVNLRKLGICTNTLDPLEEVSSIVEYLNKRFPTIELFLRPHPGSKDKVFYQKLANDVLGEYSDPDVEDAFAFLKKVDAIIACDSSILLEAVLLNVYPIYYDYRNEKIDSYGYVKNGLADYANNYRDLGVIIDRLINNKPYIRNKAKYYCETVGTESDGKSTELAKYVISSIVFSNSKLNQGEVRVRTKRKNIGKLS